MRKNSNKCDLDGQSGFSLVELLVVILVVGIMIAVAAPSLFGPQTTAKDAETKQVLTVSMVSAKSMYSQAEGHYPSSGPMIDYLSDDNKSYTYATSITNTKKVRVERHSDSSVEFCKQSESGVAFCVRHDGTGSLLNLQTSAPNDMTSVSYSIGYGTSLTNALTAARCINMAAADDGTISSCTNGYAGWKNNKAGPVPPVSTVDAVENTALPSISGDADVGAELTAAPGTWINFDGTYSYQWQSSAPDGLSYSNISGATSATYTTVAADNNKILRVIVTADGTPATSLSTETVSYPVNTVLPSITGTVEVSETLTASPGTWTHHISGTYSYQWQRGTGGSYSSISGATNSTYIITQADVNNKLRVIVAAGQTAAASEETATVSPAVNTVAPAVTGTTEIGNTLTSNSGTWTYYTGTYTYQWQRSTDGGTTFTDISGQTSTTYVSTFADVGNPIRSVVTAGSVSASSNVVTGATYADVVKADIPSAYWRMSAASASSTIASAFGSPGPLRIAAGRTSATFGGTASTCGTDCSGASPIATDAADRSTYLSSSKPAGTEVGKFAYATDTASTSITNDLAIELWFYQDGNEPNPGFGASLISKCTASAYNAGFDLYRTAYQGSLALRTGNATNNASYSLAFTPSSYKWYHIVVSVDSSKVAKLYVNGVLTTTTAAFAYPASDGAGDLRVGGTCANSDQRFKGFIDEIALYDSVLSQARITKHFQTSGFVPVP